LCLERKEGWDIINVEDERMKKNVILGIMLTLLLTGMLTLAFNIKPAKASGTIYIRADGSIDPPTAPISTLDNITYTFTDNIYDEIVVERDSIVVDGRGYSVQGSGASFTTGISLEGRKNVTIKKMEIKTFDYGIQLYNCSSIVISGNNIRNNSWDGLLLHYSSSNIISGNNITNNNGCGVWLWTECNGNTVSRNNITNNFNGLEVSDSSNNNTISTNNITANRGSGIEILISHGNNIHKNNIINNTYQGIEIYSSSKNTIFGNNIINNQKGIQLRDSSSDNAIHGNSITNNTYGCYLGGLTSCPSNTMFYHNIFISNTNQAYPYWSLNTTWDNGYPSGGNYWSSYTGVDADGDGIGDTPYVIDADNQDRYPLMYPWSPLPVHNINTGLGYAKIQEAINVNETVEGHTIFVEAGIYYENVVINKTLSLIGENRETTIIDGKRTGIVVLVTASNVTVSGFTIKNAEGGMRIESDGNKIENNAITDNGCGISIFFSNDNSLRDNNLTGNILNFGVEGYSLTDFIHNIDSTNTVNGKPIHYLINKSDLIIDGYAFSGIGYLAVINSTNVTVSRLHLSKNVQGVLFAYTNNSIIRDVNISENSVGIYLVNSENNSIYNNVVIANYRGFYIEHSNNNTIYHNNVIQNLLAQVLSFYSTNMWDNSYPSGGNYWSDYAGVDVKRGPNQDLSGSDGIGDTPYTIDANNIDRCPLMAPFSTFEAGTWNNVTYYVDMITNSTVSDFNFDQDRKMINLNVTGLGGTDGFSRVSIPKKLLWCESLEEWRVHIIGIELPIGWRPTILEDDNYTYIYMPYWHPASYSVPIQIEGTYAIPEFPPAILLPLLMILSIIAVVFAKKKRKTKAIFQSPISI
jgi:parallel beta-helix repeat protein